MPQKKDPYKSPTEKGIRLFSKLFFTKKAYSLSELANLLHASKQTVLRLLGDIEKIYGIRLESYVENRQKYYRIAHKPCFNNHVPLTVEELQLLELCKIFTSHLLGAQILNELETAIEKSCVLLPEGEVFGVKAFDAALFGTIDYTPYSDFLKNITSATEKHRVCDVIYRSIGAEEDAHFLFKPTKIFSRRDTIYVYGFKVQAEEEKPRVLSLHRFCDVKVCQESFKYPERYDFSASYNETFGVIKDKPFKVIAEFEGKPAHYIAERRWSPNQQIEWIGQDKIRISFTASSEQEVTSWIMAFGDLGLLIEPVALAEKIAQKFKQAIKKYEAHHNL